MEYTRWFADRGTGQRPTEGHRQGVLGNDPPKTLTFLTTSWRSEPGVCGYVPLEEAVSWPCSVVEFLFQSVRTLGFQPQHLNSYVPSDLFSKDSAPEAGLS